MAESKTTVTLTEAEREDLDEFIHEEHHRVGDAVGMLTEIVPDLDEIREEGCANCGSGPLTHLGQSDFPPLDKSEGVIEYIHIDPEHTTGASSEFVITTWFCSAECAAAFDEERQKAVPRDPDEVVIGGRNETRTTVHDATFILDGEQMEVSVPIPGAFQGDEMDYTDEPVYVYKDGQVRQSGLIDHVHHYEGEPNTVLLLRWDMMVPSVYHPEEEVRREYLEEWDIMRHEECGTLVQFPRDDDKKETMCSTCDAIVSREDCEHEHIVEEPA